MAMGSGISSSVSRQANPNIMPWSPGAERVELVARLALAVLERVVDAARDVGRLLLDGGDHAARLAVDAELRVRVADLGDRSADDRRDVDAALRCVISPATITRPVVTSVSHATRLSGSSASMASRTASEIWSASLSGWPSVTDSDENR